MIHNTHTNVACVLREFDDRYEVVSVHELYDPYYPDHEAQKFQIARKDQKTSKGSVPQGGVPSKGGDEININPKTKKSSGK